MWNLVEPELLRMEPWCGTWWNLNFKQRNLYVEPWGTWTFKSGTFVWNLGKPQLFRVEPLCGTSRSLAEPGSRFRAAAPNHPEVLLEEPQAFQAVGESPSLQGCLVFGVWDDLRPFPRAKSGLQGCHTAEESKCPLNSQPRPTLRQPSHRMGIILIDFASKRPSEPTTTSKNIVGSTKAKRPEKALSIADYGYIIIPSCGHC